LGTIFKLDNNKLLPVIHCSGVSGAEWKILEKGVYSKSLSFFFYLLVSSSLKETL
jgi:hypothetical protein